MPSQGAVPAPPHVRPPRGSLAWRVWVAAGLAVALVCVVVLVPAVRTVDLTAFRGPTAAFVSRSVGRTVTFARGPAIRFSLVPMLVAHDVAVANAPWGSRPEMLRARKVELGIRLLPLLLGKLSVARLALTSPELLLETDRDGQKNWVFHAPAGGPPGAKPGTGQPLLSRFGLGGARIEGAVITYRDGRTGRETRLLAPQITLAPSAAWGTKLNLRAALEVNGTAVAVTGVVGGGDAITGAQPFPFHLTAATAGASATFEGTVARLPEFAGVRANASLEASDPSALFALLGAHIGGLRRFRLVTAVNSTAAGYAFAPLRLEAGAGSFSGSVTYAPGEPRPRVTGQLSTPRLDLTGPSERGAHPRLGSAAQPGAARLFSPTPLPLAFLDEFDGALDLRADALVLREGVEARPASARATLANGELVVSPIALTLGGGSVSGRLHVKGVRPAAFTAELSGHAVALESVLGAFAIPLRCTGGPTDLTVSLSGTGNSVHEWMASLDGHVRAIVGKGQLELGALALEGDVLAQVLTALNPFHKRESSTELRCAAVNVPIEHGVVQLNRRVGVETEKFDLMASGTANLGTESLDVELRSRATQGLGVGLSSFSGAVSLRGPLAHPSLGLNPVQTVATTATTVGAAAVTSGVSIVAIRIWERLFGKSPCKTALAQTAKAPRSPEKPRAKR